MTVRQRVFLYLVLAALVVLACGGVDYTINANLMNCDMPAKDQLECVTAASNRRCEGGGVYADGRCKLSKCAHPCDGTVALSCTFGERNGSVDWTLADCKNRSRIAGCTNGMLGTFGCYGYACTDQKCGRE